MSKVYIPLQGPGAPQPKAPSVNGWASPGYEGYGEPTEREAYVDEDKWFGLRTDNYVVVDCDSLAAARAWAGGHPERQTWMRRTPRGVHFIYRRTPDSPDAPAVGVLPQTDIRAGSGAQIVLYAPGYADQLGEENIVDFDPSWLPQRAAPTSDGEGWTKIPEGQRNVLLTSIGGSLRKAGMAHEEVLRQLASMNKRYNEPPLSIDEVAIIAHSVCRYDPDPDFTAELVDEESPAASDAPDIEWADKRYWRASQMKLKPPPTWLWDRYLPDASLVLVEGQESVGKGLFCAWAAQQVVSGERFGAEGKPEDVLWYAAEDDPDEVLRRLYWVGYEPGEHGEIRFANPRFDRLMMPKDRGQLERDVRIAKPRLIIIDPGRSYLSAPEGMHSDGSFNNEATVRPGMEALNYLAHDSGATILFVHHQNKMRDGTTREKSGGTGAFRQVARHVIVMAREGAEHALAVEKSNNSSTENTIRQYHIEINEEEGSAWFEPGKSLPAFTGIDEWIDVLRSSDAEARPVTLELVTDWEDALLLYRPEDDTPSPTVPQLAKDLGVEHDMALKVHADLVTQGWIKGGHWSRTWKAPSLKPEVVDLPLIGGVAVNGVVVTPEEAAALLEPSAHDLFGSNG